MTTVEDATAVVHARRATRPDPRAAARDDRQVQLGHHGRPQEDRDHVRDARALLLRGRRDRGALHPAAARAARRHDPERGALQRVLHDARHHDGVPARDADRGRVRQLPRAAHDRRAATSRSPASTCSGSGSSPSAACSSTRRSRSAARPTAVGSVTRRSRARRSPTGTSRAAAPTSGPSASSCSASVRSRPRSTSW